MTNKTKILLSQICAENRLAGISITLPGNGEVNVILSWPEIACVFSPGDI